MTDREADIRSKLLALEEKIAEMTTLLSRAEGMRDSLLRQLADLEGAHDRRFVPVR